LIFFNQVKILVERELPDLPYIGFAIWQVAVCGARLYPPREKIETGYNA
jgi:hypothetical protein